MRFRIFAWCPARAWCPVCGHEPAAEQAEPLAAAVEAEAAPAPPAETPGLALWRRLAHRWRRVARLKRTWHNLGTHLNVLKNGG